MGDDEAGGADTGVLHEIGANLLFKLLIGGAHI